MSRWRIGLEAYGTCFSPLLIGGDSISGFKDSFDSFVGIDVSKDKFDPYGITSDEAKLFQFSTTMDRKGFEKLKRHLAAVSVSSVLIGVAIAQFLLANEDALAQWVTPSLISDLHDLSRQRESLGDEMTSLKIEIKQLLSITFPELEHMAGITAVPRLIE